MLVAFPVRVMFSSYFFVLTITSLHLNFANAWISASAPETTNTTTHVAINANSKPATTELIGMSTMHYMLSILSIVLVAMFTSCFIYLFWNYKHCMIPIIRHLLRFRGGAEPEITHDETSVNPDDLTVGPLTLQQSEGGDGFEAIEIDELDEFTTPLSSFEDLTTR